MNRLIKSSLLYSLGNILPKISGFLLLPLYTKYLSPEEYGLVDTMQVIIMFSSLVFSLGLDRSIYRLYYDRKSDKERKTFIGTISVAFFLNMVFWAAIVLRFSHSIERVYEGIPFYPYYAYAFVTSFLISFSSIPKALLQVQEKASLFTVISLIQFGVSTLTAVILLVNFKLGPDGLLLGTIVGNIIGAALIVPFYVKNSYLCFSKELFYESLKFSLPFIPSLASSWVISMADRIFIQNYFSLSEVGIYSVAFKISSLVLIFSQGFRQAYSPFFYKLSTKGEKNKNELTSFNNAFIQVCITAALILVLFSKEIIVLFSSTLYERAYLYVPYIVISQILHVYIGVSNLSIYHVKKSWIVMMNIIVSAVLSLVFNAILIPKFGILGACFSSIISYSVYFLLSFYFAKKFYFLPISWFKHSVLIIGGYACFFLIDFLITDNLIASLIVKTCITLLIVVFNIKTGLLKILQKSDV